MSSLRRLPSARRFEPPGPPALGPTVLAATVLAAIVLAASGCGTEDAPPPTASPPTDYTLLFIDRSTSAGGTARTQEVFADSLDRIVRRYLDRPGDRLSAFAVHKKTLAKATRLDLRNRVAPLEDRAFADEQALETARFKRETQRFLDTARVRLRSFLRETADRPSFRRWTDLWGALGVASQELPAPADSVRTRVYFLSDMHESMPGPKRRDFDARLPASRSQAERWAQTDAGRLTTHMRVRPDRLQDAQFRVLLGPLATKPGAQAIKFYWLTLWAELDIPDRRIRYN